MGAFDLQALVGTEVKEVVNDQGRITKRISWTVIEAYPHFVKAMRITENETEAYTTFNIGSLITMGALKQKGVKYYGLVEHTV